MDEQYKAYYDSEIGVIEITGTEEGIKALEFVESLPRGRKNIHPCLQECIKQLDEYFKGERKEFSLNLQPEGTDFQKKVWDRLLKIPFGNTVSYLDIARALGDEKSVRGVGMANGRNKISIIIPCHRVIGGNGQLIGYGGGLWRKDWLLKHEKKFSNVEAQMELF